MERHVQPELLDGLPPSDPAAVQSRRDLRRINWLMGTAGALRAAIGRSSTLRARTPWRVVEIGAGDGWQTARIWTRLPPPPPDSVLILVDPVAQVTPAAKSRLRSHGWRVAPRAISAAQWLRECGGEGMDLVYANLVLHHLRDDELQAFLPALARVARSAVFMEPRRSRIAWIGARALALLGCHAVTRHDAVCSVRAGFTSEELTAWWPRSTGWRVREGAAGPFSHCFEASRGGGGA